MFEVLYHFFPSCVIIIISISDVIKVALLYLGIWGKHSQDQRVTGKHGSVFGVECYHVLTEIFLEKKEANS